MSTFGKTAATASADGNPSRPLGDTLPVVRHTVRALLLSSPAFLELDPPRQRQMAEAMVKVCHTAALLIREEIECEKQAQINTTTSSVGTALAAPTNGSLRSMPRRLARAQSAGSEYSGVSASRVAGTTRAILNAVSFPRFVTELINGVFKAIIDSSQQQMNSYVELLNNVSASLEGFADSNLGSDRARAWLAENYPASFELAGEEQEEDEREKSEESSPREITLRLRPGASWPSAEALKTALGLSEEETAPTSGDPDRTLVPLARRALAKQRQQMLATMVMLGMQRIVIESGRITASMRFHIDTRSAAQDDKGSTIDFRNQINAAGSYGAGPWGVSASMTNTIGYVSTQQTQTTEEMNTDLDLNSSVELNFKTDYLPLDRLSGKDRVDLIKANSLNPEAEAKITAEARTAREKRLTQRESSESARRAELGKILKPPDPPAPLISGKEMLGSAEQARKEAAAKDPKKDSSEKKKDLPEAKKDAPAAQPSDKPADSPGDTTKIVKPPIAK